MNSGGRITEPERGRPARDWPFRRAGAVSPHALVIPATLFLLLPLAPPADAEAQELMGTRIVAPEDLRVVEGPEGTISTYFDAPTSTLLNLGLRVTVLEPGETPHPVRPHTRATESMLLIHEGTLQVRLNDEIDETLHPGMVLLLGPNQWHELRNTGSAPVTFYEFAWTSPGMTGEPHYPEEAVNWRRPRF